MTTYHYEGTVALEFDLASHSYKANGDLVPNVSSIVGLLDKPALVPWAAKLCAQTVTTLLAPGETMTSASIAELAKRVKAAPRDKRESAAESGKAVHAAVERWLNDRSYRLPVDALPAVIKGFDAFRRFAEQNRIEPKAVEQRVYSRTHRYAGTMDCVGKFNDELTVFDWKTGSGIYPEAYLQTAAYAAAWAEEQHERPRKIIIGRFDKFTGEFDPLKDVVIRNVRDHALDMMAFIALRSVWDWKQGLKA